VINATGVFADDIRRLASTTSAPLLRFSKGAHIVLEREFLPGDTAILVPRTDDDRVVFVIPWKNRVLVGTTDTPVETPENDPHATADDVDYLIEHAARYLSRAPRRSDVRSTFAGLRPLPAASGRTANLRRDHRLAVESGMVTICGGKWTTYRLMASDAVDAAAREGQLTPREEVNPSTLVGPPPTNARLESDILSGTRLDASNRAEVQRLVREEMAVNVEDVLARRTRALFLDARRSADAARSVAEAMAHVTDRDAAWIERQTAAFSALAARYRGLD
jgi:glycerol-3-phosphate dehydrogenase